VIEKETTKVQPLQLHAESQVCDRSKPPNKLGICTIAGSKAIMKNFL
jgi:hypothetical protein